MARVPYSGGPEREREREREREKGDRAEAWGYAGINKALAQGLHRSKGLGTPEGNLSPGRKVSSKDVCPPRLREKGKQ